MGNSQVIKPFGNTFIEQLNLEAERIVQIYLIPKEFATSGLILVSEVNIYNYSLVNGSIKASTNVKNRISLSAINRKSDEGSTICIVNGKNQLILYYTETLSQIWSIDLTTNSNLFFEFASPTSIDFSMRDTILVGFSDNSLVKARILDVSAQNLSKVPKTGEIFDSDDSMSRMSKCLDELSQSDEINLILVSRVYKLAYSFSINGNQQKINIFCMKANTFLRVYAKDWERVDFATLDEKNKTMSIIYEKFDDYYLKMISLRDSTEQLNLVNLSVEFGSKVTSMIKISVPSSTAMTPDRTKASLLGIGFEEGSFSIVKVYSNYFSVLFSLSLDGKNCSVSQMRYDVFFDVLVIINNENQIRVFEKMMQFGKKKFDEAPLISFYNELQPLPEEKPNEFEENIPLISIDHDLLKDKDIVLYESGKNIKIERPKMVEDYADAYM